MREKQCCQCRCSTKLVEISGHCRDCFSMSDCNSPQMYGLLFDPYNELGKNDIIRRFSINPYLVNDTISEFSGYVPEDLGIGGGDDISLVLCLNCGQIQNWKPIPQDKLDSVFSVDNDSNYNYSLTEFKKRNRKRG